MNANYTDILEWAPDQVTSIVSVVRTATLASYDICYSARSILMITQLVGRGVRGTSPRVILVKSSS